MSVIVFVDAPEGKITKNSYEAVYYGSKVAEQDGTETIAVSYGKVSHDDLAKLGNYGASKVLVADSLETDDDQQITRLLVAAAEENNANVVVCSFDARGKAVAPRLAARMEAGLVAGATELPKADGGFVVRKNVFSGKAFADYEVKTEKKIVSVLPNSLMPETSDNTAEVESFNPEMGEPGLTVKEVKMAKTDGISLTEAELVVSAGRGLKGPENWDMVENLADTLGAATACSRPVADMEWRPHHEHVGQTGITIRPNLYVAIGISGAIQHLAGVNGSKCIVVINNDPEAPFFKAADYGIVGDAFEVVPRLNEALKDFKAQN